ncbi:hypothetical protein [Streptomyces aureus]|uniref:Uncharacterized protein n=1 Tax=Streptomyces aureus TaxID=193461 RepID=A0ABV4T0C5_9ACTN
MREPTDTTAPASEGRGLQSPTYGVASPALLARAGRGFARFLGNDGHNRAAGSAGHSRDPAPTARPR